MKSLEFFWQFYDGEEMTGMEPKYLEPLSDVAHEALSMAVEAIDTRLGGYLNGPGLDEDYALGVGALLPVQRAACRELSFTLCAALEKMHETVEPYLDKSVPAAEPEESPAPPKDTSDHMVDALEYAITWHAPREPGKTKALIDWAKIGRPNALRDVTSALVEQNRIMREMYQDHMAHMYQSFVFHKPPPADPSACALQNYLPPVTLCPPCAELGCHASTTLDMLCPECQKAFGHIPKSAYEAQSLFGKEPPC